MNIFRHCVLLVILVCANNVWAQSGQPAIQVPSSGATLAADDQVFDWSNNSSLANDWWLYVGANVGGRQFHDSGRLDSVTSASVSSLPTDGSTVYVRLWFTDASSAWEYVDTSYQSTTVTATPFIVGPQNGSTLTGSTTTFDFDANGMNVDHWWFYAGATLGGAQYLNSGDLGGQSSITVSDLPTEGEDIYVRLWYQASGGSWSSVDSMYVASVDANIVKPYFVTPSPGSSVTGGNEVFEWANNGVTADEWWFFAGSSQGDTDYLNSGLMVDCTAIYVSGLPTDGSTVYVTLWYRNNGERWKRLDTQFFTAT